MITSLLLLATLLLIWPRMPLAFLATWASCWLMLSEYKPTPPGSFLPHSLPATLPQAYSVVWGCCGQSVNFIPLTSAQWFSLTISLCRVFLSPGRSTLPPSLASRADLLRVHSVPWSRSSIKITNKTDHSINTWETPLVNDQSCTFMYKLIKISVCGMLQWSSKTYF